MKLSSLLPQMACALLLMASCSQEDSMAPGESPSSVGGIRITTQVSDVSTRGITETATCKTSASVSRVPESTLLLCNIIMLR